MIRRRLAALALALAALPGAGRAQSPAAAPDTLRLGELQEAAVLHSPLGRQPGLLDAQSELRLRSLGAERLPELSAAGQGQYQSDVPSIPFELPGGVSPPSPHRDSYDAHLSVQQRLYDPGLKVRRELESARLAESRARVRTSLYELRRSVDEAYFTALLLRARAAEIGAGIAEIEARLRMARDRVREGAALPSEAAALEAELLRRGQALDEVAAGEEAARAELAELTGRAIGGGDELALPDLDAEVAQARAALDELRDRPEYERFARSRELLARQRESVDAGERPRLSAFGRAGYGRPELDLLADRFDGYWLAGVRLEWAPWSWGTRARDREVLSLQEEILATEEAAFGETIHRGAIRELAEIDRLERALPTDDAIVALREQILRETRLRYDEGVVTAAELVDRETDLLEARLARATRRVELARARARFLTLVGVEVL